MEVTIVPYKGYSKSARRLHSLNPSWNYNVKQGEFFVNFGSTTKRRSGTVFLNHPDNIKKAINKLRCFTILKSNDVNVPNFTTSIQTASSFNFPVYERHLLESSQGRGIRIAQSPSQLTQAKLYVEGVPIKREYRVIAVHNTIITTMMKVPRHDRNPNFSVRNLSNGWRFSTNTVYPNEQSRLQEEALKAIKALGLQFGAVDLVVQPDNTITILEVNTAFALGRRNVEAFSNALNQYISHLKEQL